MSAVDGIDEFAAQLAGILKKKNAAYGDSFARVPTILAGMYKDVPPETLEGILFNARIQDKLGRIAKDPLAAGEDAYMDLAGYALLMANVQRLKREAKAATVKESLAAEAAEVPSEPNGRIKRDILPYVKASEWPTGWYLCCLQGSKTMFFNAYAGGFWMPDRRNATAFPSEEAAGEYLRKQGELNEAAVKNPLRGDWSSAVATDCGDVWIVRWPAVGLYFQLPRDPSQPAKWIANPHEATKFDTKEAATAWIGAQRAVEASCE